MGLFDNLFSKREEQNNLVQCPRCLVKGYVDEEDIKRLKQELRWQPHLHELEKSGTYEKEKIIL